MSTKIFVHTPPLARFTSVGSYPLAYFVASTDGYRPAVHTLCAACAWKAKHTGEDYGDRVTEIEAFVHWEGDPLSCDDCSAEIESAYGPVDPQEERCQ